MAGYLVALLIGAWLGLNAVLVLLTVLNDRRRKGRYADG